EAARPGANVAEDHEGGRAARVALRAIRTAGVFADCLQAQFAEQVLGEEVAVAARQLALEPRRQSANRSVPGYGRQRQHVFRVLGYGFYLLIVILAGRSSKGSAVTPHGKSRKSPNVVRGVDSRARQCSHEAQRYDSLMPWRN